MKAILVVDMPKNCNECVFRDTTENGHRCCATLPRTKLGEIEGHIPRHVDCPLKPMPYRYVEDKVRIETPREVEVCTHGVQIGRNMVINEILGEIE